MCVSDRVARTVCGPTCGALGNMVNSARVCVMFISHIGLSALKFASVTMLGKRVRSQDHTASPGKKLRGNIRELLASGAAPAQFAAEMMHNAAEAGAQSCSARFLAAGDPAKQGFRSRSLFNALLKDSSWPKLWVQDVPALGKAEEDIIVKMAFLLPHEVLHCILGRSPEGAIFNVAGLDPVSAKHLAKVKKDWNVENLVALSMWSDSVPYSWDRRESVEIYSWHMPGLQGPSRNLRFPFAILQKHHCSNATHEAILEVWNWSMQSLALGVFPSEGPGGQQLHGKDRLAHRGKPIGLKAVMVEVKADWKYMNEVLGLPRWNAGDGICWMCNILKVNLQDVDASAAWRKPENRTPHSQLLAKLGEANSVSTIFSCPAFVSSMFRLDWLHIMDQGVTQYFLGSLLSSIVRIPRYGRNMEARNLFLWKDLIEWYHVNDIKSDKIKNLKLNRYDHKPPVFKGSAAQVRKLVPWAQSLVDSWTKDDSTPVMMAMKAAMGCLSGCYACLTRDMNDDERHETLKSQTTRFAIQLVALHRENPDRFFLAPKVHMMLEMGQENSSPALVWNYREEDFGGSMSSLAIRRGGADTVLSTSSGALKRFMLQHEPPSLVSP